MYSWGYDDTAGWKNPGGYKYDEAKAPYLEDLAKKAKTAGPRTYSKKKEPNMSLVDPKGKTITTQSKNPLVFGIDGTGSMQTWPGEFFDRAPLLYQTLSQYRDDVEISFSVIGDAVSDDYALQVADFDKGVGLDAKLKALLGEGRGGPGIRESYELWAYFMLEHAQMPQAEKPFLFILGDEKFYDGVNPAQVKKYLGDGLQGELNSLQVWKQLAEKYDIRLLHKEFPGRDEEVLAQWRETIGTQNIVPVYDPLRVVDVAMGLVAKSWGYFEDFEKNLAARQDEKGISTVMESIRAAPELLEGVKSAYKSGMAGKSTKSKSLLNNEAK
ncbi:hypothetical protein HYS49_00875 [Candidatus Woesearchaeota archaeon]|nr:hypothetical protein [Candidatus Woesearchaeota archaeon]